MKLALLLTLLYVLVDPLNASEYKSPYPLCQDLTKDSKEECYPENVADCLRPWYTERFPFFKVIFIVIQASWLTYASDNQILAMGQ